MSAIQVDATVYLDKGLNISGAYESKVIDVQQIETCAFDIKWDGVTPILGEFEVHASNVDTDPFTKIDGSTQEITGASGKHVYSIRHMNYRYIKLVGNVTIGNSDFDITFNSRSRRS